MRSSTAPARVSQIRLPVAVALGQALGVFLAIGCPGLAFDFQLHQTLGGKADHLTQQIGVWDLLYERAQVHHIGGHRWFLGCVGLSQPDPTGKLPVTTAKPPDRHGTANCIMSGMITLSDALLIGRCAKPRQAREIVACAEIAGRGEARRD